MTLSNASADPVLQVLLEEYRIMWEEARSLKRNALAAGGLLIAVLGAALTVAIRDGGPTNLISTILYLGIPYLIFLGLFVLIWFFHFVSIVDARLAILEEQINKKSDSDLLVYQTELGRRLWNGFCLDFKDIPGIKWTRHGANTLFFGGFAFFVPMAAAIPFAMYQITVREPAIPCWIMATHYVLIIMFGVSFIILFAQTLIVRSRLIPFRQSLAQHDQGPQS